ncbi:MAG: molecular chaperone DnaJ [Syntrophaceae bacterium]|nr:molecular chaperone DnaJ [Syntrophaceae bacterium]
MAKEPRKTPEEEELNKKLVELNELRSELAQRELDLATLRGESRAFEARYLTIVGIRCAVLDEIEAQIAELQARLTPKNKSSEERATQARAKANESAQSINVEQEPVAEKGFSPSDNLKRLYRDIAKKIHPDLATGEEERAYRQRLMAEANRAYEDGDEACLEAILHEWETSPDFVKGEGVGADLIRVIRKIAQVQGRLRVIDTEIAQLKQSDLYQLRIKVEEAENVGRDLLGEMASQLDGQIAFAKQSLDKMKFRRSR